MALVSAPPRPLGFPRVQLATEEAYLTGFPALVAITLQNATAGTFLNLPRLNLFLSHVPFTTELTPVFEGQPDLTKVVRKKPSPPTGESSGVRLGPKEPCRVMVDLCGLVSDVPPGTYDVHLEFAHRLGVERTDTVRVQFLCPTEAEHAEGCRLRAMGSPQGFAHVWSHFLERNWSTVEVSSELGPQARHQLAYYSFLHRAFYGPEEPADLSLAPLAALDGPVLVPEGLLLAIEIRAARGDEQARAQLTQMVLERWPGARHRLDAIDNDQGTLRYGRRWYGAGREFNVKPEFFPYASR